MGFYSFRSASIPITRVYCVCATEVLTKENIVEPMRDIRRALLEADVSCIWILIIMSKPRWLF